MLETWDAAGQPVIDRETRLFRQFGTLRIGRDFTGNDGVGTVFDERFATGTAVFLRLDGGANAYDAVVTIAGRTLTWEFFEPVRWRNGVLVTRPNARYAYGVM
ncbi:hypothetical protein [Sphingomonas sp.]|jgi:hypothetical protein|uniref:hypothetical protein n=1 Tax=Sphingomonas sp. TaxID=28214 RepID=UPI000DBC2D43|nr:hypothetical protein [Sphingomonas sp.]PZT92464.1 MAG: hypothetical protein DI625_12510 [Sphingomonas sp.]